MLIRPLCEGLLIGVTSIRLLACGGGDTDPPSVLGSMFDKGTPTIFSSGGGDGEAPSLLNSHTRWPVLETTPNCPSVSGGGDFIEGKETFGACEGAQAETASTLRSAEGADCLCSSARLSGEVFNEVCGKASGVGSDEASGKASVEVSGGASGEACDEDSGWLCASGRVSGVELSFSVCSGFDFSDSLLSVGCCCSDAGSDLVASILTRFQC